MLRNIQKGSGWMQEVINQLINTESAADEAMANAEKQAAEIIEKAKSDGEKLFAEAKANAEKQAAAIIEDAKKNAAALYDRIMEGYDKKCSELHSSTRDIEDKAAQNIVKNLT